MSASEHSNDPCAEFGPDQRWAVVWFFAVLLLGIFLVYTFRNTDHYNYTTNGEFFDYAKYRSNRVGPLHMPSEGEDSRAQGDYNTAVQRAKP